MRVIGRNIFSLGLSRIISGVILFAVQARLAAYLGSEGFGKFSLVLAFQTMFLLFVDFGISRYAIKKISQDNSAAQAYYSSFLVTQLFFAMIVFGLFILIPWIFEYDAEVTRAMFFAGAGLLFTAMSIPAVAIVQAQQKVHVFAGVIFAESLIKASWFVFAMYRGLDLVFIFQVYLLVGIFDAIVWYFLTRKSAVPKFFIDRQMIRTMFLFGIPFAMLSGFEMLIAKIDVIIQEIFLSYSEVGLYSAAYRFLDFLTFLPAVVAISLFPHFAGETNIDSPENRALSEKIHRFLLAVAIPLGVGSTVLARNIMLSFFGPDYQGAILPFQILIWSTVITLFYGVANVIMQVFALRIAIYILGFATVFNILGNIILIPRFGIIASAWLTVLSYILVAVFYIGYSRRFLRFPIWRALSWPAISSLVMGFVLWQIRELNVFLLIGIAIVIYFSILFASGFLTKRDIEFIRSLAK